MKFIETKLRGSYVIDLSPIDDDRGWFARTYCKNEFAEINHNAEWVQLNHSFTKMKGALRGMHFQLPPYSEIKLVRCIAGSVFDVIVDLRKNSKTFLQWFGIEISAANKKMMYIPQGFAHGFQCLSDDCELIYHHSEFYKPGVEEGIRFDDPLVGIEWRLPVSEISEKDSNHPYLKKDFEGININ